MKNGVTITGMKPLSRSGDDWPQGELERRIVHEIARLNRQVLAVVLGFLCGAAIFAATMWLTIKGGENVGAHMQLLNQFYPGYTVTFRGSFIGSLYGFVTGYVAGFLIGAIYNKVVDLRSQ